MSEDTSPAMQPLEEDDEEELDQIADIYLGPQRGAVPKANKVLANLEPSTDEHPVCFPWDLWFMRRQPGARSQESYDKALKNIGGFDSVEGYWSYSQHMVRPNELPNGCDYSLFRRGVKPMWEDDENRQGGKWLVRVRKGQANRTWENLVLAMIGDEFGMGNEVCGAVVSIRFPEDIIAVWNMTAEDYEAVRNIRDVLRRCLNLPGQAVMEYKRHDSSMKENSTYRTRKVKSGDGTDGEGSPFATPESVSASPATPGLSGLAGPDHLAL